MAEFLNFADNYIEAESLQGVTSLDEIRTGTIVSYGFDLATSGGVYGFVGQDRSEMTALRAQVAGIFIGNDPPGYQIKGTQLGPIVFASVVKGVPPLVEEPTKPPSFTLMIRFNGSVMKVDFADKSEAINGREKLLAAIGAKS